MFNVNLRLRDTRPRVRPPGLFLTGLFAAGFLAAARFFLPLAILVMFISGGLLSINPAYGQSVPALPVAPVETAPLTNNPAAILSRGPVIIELFSSQACAFCPRADRLLADLAQQVHVIALACHVDYFDVRSGALSHPFCSARQDWYMRALRGGPNYTPQIIVQGRYDAIGYDIPAVTQALRRAAAHIPPAVTIASGGEPGRYRVTLPALRKDKNYKIFLLIFDQPHNVIVSEGRNKGQKMNYVNIVSAFEDLGTWNAQDSDDMMIDIQRKPEQRGFAILAQDEKTGAIAAAGRYIFGQKRHDEPDKREPDKREQGRGEQEGAGPLRSAPASE